MSEFLQHEVEGISAPQVTKKPRQTRLPIHAEGELAISTYLSEGVVGAREKMDSKRVYKCVTYGSLPAGTIYSREYKKDCFLVETKGKGEQWPENFKVWVFEVEWLCL